MVLANMQLGKAGVTKNFIDNVKSAFKKHDQVKVSIHQSFSRDKVKIKEAAQKICEGLEDKRFYFKPRQIGFTITLLRFKKKKANK